MKETGEIFSRTGTEVLKAMRETQFDGFDIGFLVRATHQTIFAETFKVYSFILILFY